MRGEAPIPLRRHIAVALALLAYGASSKASGEEDDDPKHAAAPSAAPAAPAIVAPPLTVIEPRPSESALLAAGEDDPKLQRLGGRRDRGPASAEEHPAPAVKLAYRHLTLPNLDHSDASFQVIELDLYPISLRYFRIGLEGELGFGSGTLDGKPSSAWYLLTGFDAGFQYPWRVTPFVDLRFLAGIIGGDVAGVSAISWSYHYGVDVGGELYIADRFYVSLAIGWAHPVYRGLDFAYTKTHPPPQYDPRFIQLDGDSFTIKVGLGL